MVVIIFYKVFYYTHINNLRLSSSNALYYDVVLILTLPSAICRLHFAAVRSTPAGSCLSDGADNGSGRQRRRMVETGGFGFEVYSGTELQRSVGIRGRRF